MFYYVSQNESLHICRSGQDQILFELNLSSLIKRVQGRRNVCIILYLSFCEAEIGK